MTDNTMFELFRKVHHEAGMHDDVIISERWRLMQPFKGMNQKPPAALEELMRQYVQSMR